MRQLNLDFSEYTEIEDIRLKARPGSNIDNCISEAMIIAILNNSNVTLSHNDNVYNINRAGLNNAVTDNIKTK